MTTSHGKVINLSSGWLGVRWERLLVYFGVVSFFALFVWAVGVGIVLVMRRLGV